jgi:hypothetical protein
MGIRHSETADRVTFEVEFYKHYRHFADNPAVMSRFDRHDLRRLVFHDTAVGVFDVDFAAGEEADVSVHAQVRPDNRLHVDRPSESDGIDHSLDTRGASSSNFEPNAADVPALRAFHGRDDRTRHTKAGLHDAEHSIWSLGRLVIQND